MQRHLQRWLHRSRAPQCRRPNVGRSEQPWESYLIAAEVPWESRLEAAYALAEAATPAPSAARAHGSRANASESIVPRVPRVLALGDSLTSGFRHEPYRYEPYAAWLAGLEGHSSGADGWTTAELLSHAERNGTAHDYSGLGSLCGRAGCVAPPRRTMRVAPCGTSRPGRRRSVRSQD